MTEQQYHIAQTGKRAGKMVICRAKSKCKIGNLPSEEIAAHKVVRRSYDFDTLRNAVNESKSLNELFAALGIPYANPLMREYIKSRMDSFGISYSELSANWTPVRYAEGESSYSRKNALRQMLTSGIPYRCVKCGAERLWRGGEITLEIDHIDGRREHNRLENLRFLCPNCHSQTFTHGMVNSRTIDAIKQLSYFLRPKNKCNCGREKLVDSSRCLRCFIGERQSELEKFSNGRSTPRKGKVDWPEDEVLVEMAKATSWNAVAKSFGVSNPTLFVRMKKRGWDTATFSQTKEQKLTTNYNITIYPKDILEEASKYVTTYRGLVDLLRSDGFKNASYKRVLAAIDHHKIDVSHFSKQHTQDVWNRTKPNKELLKLGSSKTKVRRIELLRAMVTSGITYKCKICGNAGEWRGANLPLAIDHINGVHHDNRKPNLRFLCPNCHSQQPTSYHSRGKNTEVDRILLELDMPHKAF